MSLMLAQARTILDKTLAAARAKKFSRSGSRSSMPAAP